MKPIHVEFLVVDRWSLGSNLILGNDAIRFSGGIAIMQARVVSFAGKKATVCAAICLDEPDFCAVWSNADSFGLLSGNGPEDGY